MHGLLHSITLFARHSAGFLLSVYGKVRFVVNKDVINTRERVSSPFLRKKSQDLAKQAGQNRKIRAIAHFNELKTYKSAKKISLFLVRLLSGLRLLYGRNLLL
jgi:hypothetical protein